jgi:1,4-alpha-glucan branching enzyme
MTTSGNGATRTVYLVGDFNNWNRTAKPMKTLKNGTFYASISLVPNREYHFRCLLDGQRWENDWTADKYVPNDYGTENSVVVV